MLCLLLRAGIIPRHILHLLPIGLHIIVATDPLPRTSRMRATLAEERLILDAVLGKVDISLDGLVGGRLGEKCASWEGGTRGGHFGGEGGGKVFEGCEGSGDKSRDGHEMEEGYVRKEGKRGV